MNRVSTFRFESLNFSSRFSILWYSSYDCLLFQSNVSWTDKHIEIDYHFVSWEMITSGSLNSLIYIYLYQGLIILLFFKVFLWQRWDFSISIVYWDGVYYDNNCILALLCVTVVYLLVAAVGFHGEKVFSLQFNIRKCFLL